MPIKNLWKANVTRDWTKLEKEIRQANNIYIRNEVLADFKKIVAPFRTDIPFHVIRFPDRDNLVTVIEPTPGVTFTRESDKEQIEVGDLWQWLDKGTSVKNVKILGPYTRVTSPDSLDTFSHTTPSAKVLASKKLYDDDGIEARNWTQFLIEKHSEGFRNTILNVINEFLNR